MCRQASAVASWLGATRLALLKRRGRFCAGRRPRRAGGVRGTGFLLQGVFQCGGHRPSGLGVTAPSSAHVVSLSLSSHCSLPPKSECCSDAVTSTRNLDHFHINQRNPQAGVLHRCLRGCPLLATVFCQHRHSRGAPVPMTKVSRCVSVAHMPFDGSCRFQRSGRPTHELALCFQLLP